MKLKTTFFSRLMRPFLATAAFASLVLSANAAAYMKLGDIKGEAIDNDHKEWINLLSVSAAMSRPLTTDPATGQRRRGDVVLEDIVCTKELDKSSPKLMEAVCTGVVLPLVVIELTKPVADATGATREQPYLRYELKNVMVTSYNLANIGSSGQDGVQDPAPTPGVTAPEKPAPTTCSLNFEEIKVTYTEYDKATGGKKGNVEYSWKVEEGTR